GQGGVEVGVRERPVARRGPGGEFEAKGVAARDDLILVAAKAELVGEPSEAISLKEGAPPPSVTLKLTQGASISGKVIDGAGAAIPGAMGWFWSQEGRNYGSNNTPQTTGLQGPFP